MRTHYRDQGLRDGPVLVLIHGFAASLEAWEPWVGQLGDRYRIVTVDLPGHGLTRTPPGYRMSSEDQVAIVDALASELGVQRFVIGGNSMGGGVAWRYALVRPEKVEALILVNSAGASFEGGQTRNSGSGSPIAFRLLANPVGRALLRNANPRLVARQGLASAYAEPSIVTPALVDRYVDMALAPDRRRMLTSGRREDRPLSAEAFKAISAPTLVLHGAEDKVIDPAAGRALAAAIPRARLIVYPGVGHAPMETIPVQSARDVDEFLSNAVSRAEHGSSD